MNREIEEFNGYDFKDRKARKRMKYLIIRSGDLDLNNAYAFKSKKELESFLKDTNGIRELLAVFKIEEFNTKD